jgi:hypothetical protein
MHWTCEQRAFAVEAYFSNVRFLIATQRAFHSRFRIRPSGWVRDRKLIVARVNTYRAGGSANARGPGPCVMLGQRTAPTPKTVALIILRKTNVQ